MVDEHSSPRQFAIDDLILDSGRRKVFRNQQSIDLPKLSFDLFLSLIRAAPNVVSTDMLVKEVWGNLVVSDETLTQRVKMLRDALDEDGNKQRYIETVRSVGYRLRPEVTRLESELATNLDSSKQPRMLSVGRMAVALTILALVIAYAVHFKGDFRSPSKPADGTIAVLPFVAMSDGPDDGYFADGLTEEILNSLTQLPELLVTARTSAFYFKGRDLPVQEIAATLGVAHIVEGSIRRDRDHLRITAQLVRADDGFHVWSDSFSRTSEDIFAVQIDIAEKVAAALDIVLDDDLRAKMRNFGVRDPEAFIAYQKGVELFDRAHGSSRILELLAQANTQFEIVIERAPNFPNPYIQHSDYYSHILLTAAAGVTIDGHPGQDIDTAGESLLTDFDAAVRLASDDRYREIIALDRAIFVGDWKNLDARLDRVNALPTCAISSWLETVALPFDNASASRPLIERWVECDPLNFSANAHQIRMLIWLGEFEAALDASTKALQTNDHPFFRVARVLALVAMEQQDEVEALIARSPNDAVMTIGAWFWLSAHRGDAASAEAALELSHGFFATSPGDLMAYYAVLGNREGANRIAAGADANRFGHMVLANAILICYCGAPFDLEVTPNFARMMEESGLTWPPAQPIEWPLKTW